MGPSSTLDTRVAAAAVAAAMAAAGSTASGTVRLIGVLATASSGMGVDSLESLDCVDMDDDVSVRTTQWESVQSIIFRLQTRGTIKSIFIQIRLTLIRVVTLL